MILLGVSAAIGENILLCIGESETHDLCISVSPMEGTAQTFLRGTNMQRVEIKDNIWEYFSLKWITVFKIGFHYFIIYVMRYI